MSNDEVYSQIGVVTCDPTKIHLKRYRHGTFTVFPSVIFVIVRATGNIKIQSGARRHTPPGRPYVYQLYVTTKLIYRLDADRRNCIINFLSI